MTVCPCGTGRDLDACCGPIIAGTIPAPTCEALMRSRYSAFVTGRLEHVENTHVPEIRDDFNRAEAEQVAASSVWRKLEVLRSSETGDTGTVEFVIRFRRDGQDMLHHEKASFRREEGRWLYIDGEINPKEPPRQVVKIGRNDPCHCGSGRKYKKCCGA